MSSKPNRTMKQDFIIWWDEGVMGEFKCPPERLDILGLLGWLTVGSNSERDEDSIPCGR